MSSSPLPNLGDPKRNEAGERHNGEKKFKVTKKKKTLTAPALPSNSNGQVDGPAESIDTASRNKVKERPKETRKGGTSESIYATYNRTEDDGWLDTTSSAIQAAKPKIVGKGKDKGVEPQSPSSPEGNAGVPSISAAPRHIRESRSGLSLSERLGMDDLQAISNAQPLPISYPANATNLHTDSSKGKEHRSRPTKIDLPDQRDLSLLSTTLTPDAQTPLSASHSPPETPLKYMWRGGDTPADLPATPKSEAPTYKSSMSRAMGGGTGRLGGLLLNSDEGISVLPQELQTPRRESFSMEINHKSPTPLPTSATTNAAKSQIDHMLAKLRLSRTGPTPSSGGTSESRWAVKETSETALVGSSAEKQMAEVEAQQTPPVEVPTAARAFRSAPQNVKAEQATSLHAAPKAKSLLERISPAVAKVENAGDDSKPAKGKKERTRGSRKAEARADCVPKASSASATIASQASTYDVDDTDGAKTPVVPSEGEFPPVLLPSQFADDDASTPEELLKEEVPVTADSKVEEGEEEEEDAERTPQVETIPSFFPTSSSAASVTALSTETSSNVGNDTFGSINWADDDDDDMPELPEEWTRGMSSMVKDSSPPSPTPISAAAALSSPSSPSSSRRKGFNDEGEESYASNTNGTAKRGLKRGGKGRSRKEREGDAANPTSTRAPRGQQIAGSAAAPPKELFPSHNDQSYSLPRGPKTNQGRSIGESHREQRPPHGRPKLMASNKDTFSRLAKGAVKVNATPATTSSHEPPPRNSRKTTAAIHASQ